jgi:hypothetical protein
MTHRQGMHLGAIACLTSFNLSLAMAQPASAEIPTALQVPASQALIATVRAEGDQIYRCSASSGSPNQFEWALQAPEATLLKNGVLVGKHYGGPTWESLDGSKIVGQVKTKANAPQADAIPWLLLQVKTHQGQGSLSQVNWVQRVDTSGGKAPSTGCDRAHENAIVRVGYGATYHFYGDENQPVSNVEY